MNNDMKQAKTNVEEFGPEHNCCSYNLLVCVYVLIRALKQLVVVIF